MSKIDKKLEQIKLQHRIAEVLREDNGVSCHFDYHVNLLSEDETIRLNLLTYNERHDEYMLMHTTQGATSIICLEKMWQYLEGLKKTGRQYSYTIRWSKKGDETQFTSYFWGKSEADVLQKFLHEKNPGDYTFNIVQNPVA